MAEDVATLFGDYAARYVRGERPDTRAYLARAGEEAEEFAGMLDMFLARAPAPAPDEDSVALATAWIAGQPPILDLRTRRGLRVEGVVDALMGALGLDPAKRGKVKRYYQELETGLLEPRRVDRRVWDVLAETLRASAEALLAWRPRPVGPEPTFFRTAASEYVSHRLTPAQPAPAGAAAEMFKAAAAEEPDEIDRLFRGQ